MVTRLSWATPPRATVQHRAYRNAAVAFCGRTLPGESVWSNRARSPCGECRSRDPEAAEYIEFLIEYLASGVEMKVSPLAVNPLKLSARDFDGAEPFLRTDLTHDDGDTVMSAEPHEVDWPLDLKLILRIGDREEDETEDGLVLPSGWSFQRYRSLTPKEARGRVFPSLPYPIEWTLAYPAAHDAFQFICGHPRPQLWVPINMAGTSATLRSRGVRNQENDLFSERMMIGLGIWARRRRQWRVYLALDGKPGIELPTDPVGARAAFRLRDIPDGRKRRQALLHWVTEHWRQSRSDPTEERLVREHLAGQRAFAWNGLTCKITPSKVDSEREQDAIEARAEARATSSDRRATS